MILVTVGTNEQPFDRLVRAAAGIGGDEPLFVQHGSSHVERGRGEWVDFLAFDELAAKATSARVVVCHAGVGSIMLARRCDRPAIVMPRRRHLGEAVDDHQVGLARRLARAGLVTVVEDGCELAAALRDGVGVRPGAPASRVGGAHGLTAELREVLSDLGVAARSRAA